MEVCTPFTLANWIGVLTMNVSPLGVPAVVATLTTGFRQNPASVASENVPAPDAETTYIVGFAYPKIDPVPPKFPEISTRVPSAGAVPVHENCPEVPVIATPVSVVPVSPMTPTVLPP